MELNEQSIGDGQQAVLPTPTLCTTARTGSRSSFRGHPVAIDAPLSRRRAKYPLLLLSHGTGGSADSLDWLGAALAAAGYVVAGANHPGNNVLELLTREGFVMAVAGSALAARVFP